MLRCTSLVCDFWRCYWISELLLVIWNDLKVFYFFKKNKNIKPKLLFCNVLDDVCIWQRCTVVGLGKIYILINYFKRSLANIVKSRCEVLFQKGSNPCLQLKNWKWCSVTSFHYLAFDCRSLKSIFTFAGKSARALGPKKKKN